MYTGCGGFVGMDYKLYVKRLDAVRRYTEEGTEYWMARDLMPLLTYSDWRNFSSVVEKAVSAAKSAGMPYSYHFVETTEKVSIGSDALRGRADWFLSRYACYLIAMNGDTTKEEVGHAQTYFVAQTRRQEIQDTAIETNERLRLRLRVMDGNKQLAGAAKQANVTHFPYFQDAGHQGLYGMSLASVKVHKGLGVKEELLDRVGELELSAHDFKARLTTHRLTRNNVKNEADAIDTHRKVGREVRDAIERDNGVKPESLPIEPSIKPLVQKHKRQIKKAQQKLN
jgi:DNA-damage-inducible protein D